MAAVADLVLGKAFEALYAGVEDLINKNRIFPELFIELKSRLDRLAPLIKEMAEYNQQLDVKKHELEAIEKLMKSGIELVSKCAKIHWWNPFRKYKYANKFIEFKESLQIQLEDLKVQMVRDVKKIEVVAESIQNEMHNIHEEVSILVKQNQFAKVEALPAVLPDIPDLTVGLDAPLKELKMMLVEDDQVSILVVTAPGGCGKTTLATKFCQDEQVKDKFKSNIFFVTFSKKPNLKLIMKELYKQKGYEEPSEVKPKNWLQKVQEEKGDDPLLLVLDDVWSGSESLLDQFESKMSNYKILVTSRSEFWKFGSSYRLPLLDNDNAMKLFHHTASLGDKSSHIPEELSAKIVKHCHGFPLAITVTGRSLCGQPKVMWQSRLLEWSKGHSIFDSETELLLSLQSSIDALDDGKPQLKECFLDLGAFPEDATIQASCLIDMWAVLYDNLDEETLCYAKLHELRNNSLANYAHSSGTDVPEESRHSGEFFVRQHDLLRELVIYHSKRVPIECRERLFIELTENNFPKWWREQKYQPTKARLVSISTDGDFSSSWSDMHLPEAEVLVLNCQAQPDSKYVLPEFVKKMDKLKMLAIISYGYYIPIENGQVLGSLSHLTSLRLDGFNISFLTESSVQVNNLRNLYLRQCKSEVPVKLSHVFPNLKDLVIDNCDESVELPVDLCELFHLTKLVIYACWKQTVLPEAIGDLVNLQVLIISNCKRFSELPESIMNLQKLNYLDFSCCDGLMLLPEHMGELTSLTKLRIYQCKLLSALPDGMRNLVKLEELNIHSCSELKELPEHIGELKSLRKLNMAGCSELKELPEHIGELKSLRKLNMGGCTKLTKLPQSISDLEQLEEVICEEWDAPNLWQPFLPSLKNLRILAWDGHRYSDWLPKNE